MRLCQIPLFGQIALPKQDKLGRKGNSGVCSCFREVGLVQSLLILCVLMLIVAALPASGAEEFLTSYWCGPPADTDPNERYAEVAECNFNYCLPPCGAISVEQNKAVLDACAKYGLKYIIGDGRIMAKNPDDPDFAANLDAVIADYANHPATGGYFITDEPNSSAFPKLAAINQYLLKKDPKHLPFINLFPNYANQQQLGNPTYEEHVQQFCSVVKPRILSYDHYIMMACDPEKPANLTSYFQNMEIVRSEGLKNGIPTSFILLVIPHWSYRNPTEADIRWQVYTALAYGMKAILYFTYWTPGGDMWEAPGGIINPKGERTEHFNQVKRINGELKVLGPILMKLTSTGVYHTGEIPGGCKALDSGLPIQIEGSPLVLGMFEHQDGSTWAMVVNRHLRESTTACLTFDSSVTSVQEVSGKTGVLRNLKLSERSATLDLRPSEGRLLKLLR